MKHPPRNIVIDWLNTVWSTDLPSNAKLVACNLRRYMNSQNDMAWPSVARIAGECGLSDRTVQTMLKLLSSEGWIIHNGTSNLQTRIYQASTPEMVAPPKITTQRGEMVAPKLNKELNNTLSKRFTPPTIEQLKEYQAQAGLTFDPDHFIDYWSSVGWKRGRTPMKDWKATARNWARNENNANTKRHAGQHNNTRKLSGGDITRQLREEARRKQSAT